MLVLITYDVNTETASGKKRLRKVAKECQNYGQRVQNSVFECIMDNAKTKEVQAKLLEIIDLDKDSLRFYYLGNAYKNKVEHYGTKQSIDLEGTLIIWNYLIPSYKINSRICDKIPFSKIFLNLDIVKCRKKKFLIISVKKEYLEIKYRKY